jgi:tellurite resistance protein
MDYIDTNSDLKVAADAFADALNMALWYIQRYLGEIQDGEQSKYMAKMNGMFAVTASDVQEIVALMNLESSGKMRIESLYKELKRRGAIADDFDIESETAYAAENADNPEGV